MSTLDKLLTCAAASRLLPGRPHPSTIWRWARRGLRARDGRIIHLEHVRLGSRVYVTVQALERFGRAMARADVAEASAGPRADERGAESSSARGTP